MSQAVLKLVLGFNILQKWIMTDFQRTVTSCSLLNNAVLLRPGGSSPLPGLRARMWNSDEIMYDLFFHSLSTLDGKEVGCDREKEGTQCFGKQWKRALAADFPTQLCDTPLMWIPLIPLTKSRKESIYYKNNLWKDIKNISYYHFSYHLILQNVKPRPRRKGTFQCNYS